MIKIQADADRSHRLSYFRKVLKRNKLEVKSPGKHYESHPLSSDADRRHPIIKSRFRVPRDTVIGEA